MRYPDIEPATIERFMAVSRRHLLDGRLYIDDDGRIRMTRADGGEAQGPHPLTGKRVYRPSASPAAYVNGRRTGPMVGEPCF